MKKLILLLMLFVYLCIGCGFTSTAFAESSYSSVLDDLEKDPTFNAGNYPMSSKDYSLSLITIAESTDNQLLVYVYQPCGRLTASHIRFSTTIDEDLSPKDYTLTLINSSGSLFKYVVNNFKLSSDTVRYYEIVCLFRQWDSSLDQKQPDWNENNVDYVSFSVGTRYMATTVNGETVFNCTNVEVIEIVDPYVGYIRYPGGFLTFDRDCDSWFIAFNTDKPIDRLVEADVYYDSAWYHAWTEYYLGVLVEKEQTGENMPSIVSLSYDDKGIFTGDGLFHVTYEWQRISTVDDFVKSEDLTDEGIEDLKGLKWILRFVETQYTYSGNEVTDEYNLSSTKISNVSILRLKFETDGKVYNLGAVSNVISPGENQDPDNNTGIDWRLWFEQTWQKICDIFGMLPWWAWVIIAVVVIALLAAVIKPIGQVVLFVLKLIWYIVSAPFRLVVWIVQTIRNKRQ